MSRDFVKLVILLWLLVTMSACRAPTVPGTPGDDLAQATAAGGDMASTAVSNAGFDCAGTAEISGAECQALLAFFEATKGAAWIDSGGWLESTLPCSWLGVSCVDGHVDMLALSNNGLGGQLPSQLAALSGLRVVDLHNNQISGSLPVELGQLAHLEYLDLSTNAFAGSIPATLGDLTVIQTISLAHNQLSGAIPARLGRAATLRNLDLSYNHLAGSIPAELGGLAALETLRLRSNELQGEIPFELGEAEALVEVDLSFNQLTGQPPAALTQASVHNLWGNRLDGTIFSSGGQAQNVNFLGAAFTFDGATADSVWAELVPAALPVDGPGMPWSSPEHIAFTLVRNAGPQAHMPLGLYLPAEAQIHIYPTAALNAEAHGVVEGLQALLAVRPAAVELEVVEDMTSQEQIGLTMLPPTNARQTLRAQIAYLDFEHGSGVRYLTQLSQGPVAVNNQELFYTFQGLSNDGALYVAAYFPVSLPALPPTGQLDDEAYASLLQDWQGYLRETVMLLNQQEGKAFTPDLTALDTLLQSLSLQGVMPVAQLEGVWPENGEPVDAEPVLQWVAYEGAARYEVVVVDDDVYPPQAVFSAATEETALSVTPALEAGSYSWTVRALDGDEQLLAELNRSFLVKDRLEQVSPQDGETLNDAPLLAWYAYPGAASYQVVVLDDDAFPPVVVLDETTAETTFAIDLALEPGSYSWTLWAKDGNGVVVAELASQFSIASE